MAVITRLVVSKGRSKKVRVYLDGKYAFCLEAEVALESGLRVNQALGQQAGGRCASVVTGSIVRDGC